MAGPARVFISYSNKDTDLVDRLKTALADAGVDVWLDHEQLTPGTPDWRMAVMKGIEQATDVVYVASLDAADSRFVGHELAIASDEGKRILPFWVRGDRWASCAPMGYYYAQFIDGRDAVYAAGLAKLLATLGVASPVTAATTLSRIPLSYTRCHTQIRRAVGRCFVEVVALRFNYSLPNSTEQFVYSREVAQNHHQDHRLDEIAALNGVRKELEQNGWKCESFDPDYGSFHDGIWARDVFVRR